MFIYRQYKYGVAKCLSQLDIQTLNSPVEVPKQSSKLKLVLQFAKLQKWVAPTVRSVMTDSEHGSSVSDINGTDPSLTWPVILAVHQIALPGHSALPANTVQIKVYSFMPCNFSVSSRNEGQRGLLRLERKSVLACLHQYDGWTPAASQVWSLTTNTLVFTHSPLAGCQTGNITHLTPRTIFYCCIIVWGSQETRKLYIIW